MVFLLQLKLPQRDQAVKAWNDKYKYQSIYLNTNLSGKWVDLRRQVILCIVDSETLAYLQVLQQPLGKNEIVP